MLFFMNIEQKLIEVEKVKNALISMGIDINYMGIICPEHDRADAYTALLTLFLLVNEETKYGKIELPTTPSSLSRMNKFKEQYKHHHEKEAEELDANFQKVFKARMWVETAMRNPLAIAHNAMVAVPILGYGPEDHRKNAVGKYHVEQKIIKKIAALYMFTPTSTLKNHYQSANLEWIQHNLTKSSPRLSFQIIIRRTFLYRYQLYSLKLIKNLG